MRWILALVSNVCWAWVGCWTGSAPPPGLSLGITIAGALPITVLSFTEAGGSTAEGSLVVGGGYVARAVAEQAKQLVQDYSI